MARRLGELLAVAAGHGGQFATWQARGLGFTPDALTHLRRKGIIEPLRQGVWRLAGTAGEPDPAMTAYLALWPEAVISHESAAVAHGITRVAVPEQPTVTVPDGRFRRTAGITVHLSRNLDRDVLELDGARYTTVARTVCDLAASVDPWEALAILDEAICNGARRSWVHARARALCNGRTGVRLVRDATDPTAAAELRSWLERATGCICRASGIPDPDWNVRITDEAGLIGVVDALWRPWRVVVECEGLRFHTSPAQRRKDAARFNRLGDSGYSVRRVTWEDVVHVPTEVAATVLRVLNAAGARLDPARIPREIILPPAPYLGGAG